MTKFVWLFSNQLAFALFGSLLPRRFTERYGYDFRRARRSALRTAVRCARLQLAYDESRVRRA